MTTSYRSTVTALPSAASDHAWSDTSASNWCRVRTLVRCFAISLALILSACTPDATLIRDSGTEGVVVYSVATEAERLTSPSRREATRLIDQKCPAGANIIREGEVPRVRADVDRMWQGHLRTDKQWGIQFRCK